MIETDEEALARATAQNGDISSFWKALVPPGVDPRKPYSVFFVYMRLNTDGTFEAHQYYHEGTKTDIIGDSGDPKVLGSIGYYAQDMAKYARSKTSSKHTYQDWAPGLDDMNFPPRYSWCVFFMDELHWEFLMDGTIPYVFFHDKKFGQLKPLTKHDKAFEPPRLLEFEMPKDGVTDMRKAVVMINRMRDKDDKQIQKWNPERYCFDLWMRVKYGNAAKKLTIIIDPTGTNTGPPVSPPDDP